MKKLFTLLLLLCVINTQAQTMLGEKSSIIQESLFVNHIKYHTIYEKSHRVSFIIRDEDYGTITYYFKKDICVSYCIVRYDISSRDIKWSFDQQYKKDGQVWCSGDNYITLGEVSNIVFINVF